MLNDFGKIICFLLIIGLVILLIWFFVFKVKHLKTSNVYFVDGGVKTGKSLVCGMLLYNIGRGLLLILFFLNTLIILIKKLAI